MFKVLIKNALGIFGFVLMSLGLLLLCGCNDTDNREVNGEIDSSYTDSTDSDKYSGVDHIND